MSRIDTTSFANSLMGGLQTGIQLGQNADAQRFARERAGAQDRQTQFGNMLALDAREMRRQELVAMAEERVSRREELERKRKATFQLMQLVGDENNQYNPSDPSFAPLLEAVDRETQDRFYSVGSGRKQVAQNRAIVEARKASGHKFSLREADQFEKDGIFIEDQYLLPTAKTEREKMDDADKQHYLITMQEKFGLDPNTARKWYSSSAKFVSDRYNEMKTVAEAVAKQVADQQAEQVNFTNARTAGVAAGVDVKKMDAMIGAKKAGFTLPEGAFGGESDSAARAGLNQRIQAAKTAWEMAQKDLEPFAAAVSADPLTGEPTNSDVTGTGGFLNAVTLGMGRIQDENDKKLIATYQQKKKAADEARRNYEALNQQAMGGGAIGDDLTQRKRERALQLKAQNVPVEQARSILLQEFGE